MEEIFKFIREQSVFFPMGPVVQILPSFLR
jgi:hypothetical protein